MKELSNQELFDLGMAKLNNAKAKLKRVMEINDEARARARAANDCEAYQCIAEVSSGLHAAMAGAEAACAKSLSLKQPEVVIFVGGK